MATIGLDHASQGAALRVGPSRVRWAWLAAGAACGVVGCGGRWDLAVAAWLAPIFLLRFSRTSPLLSAFGGLLLAALVQTTAYLLLTAIPLNPLTILLCGLVSIAGAAPAILDRWLGRRLSAAGRIFLFPTVAVAGEYAVGSVLPVGTALGMRAITQGENLALLQVTAITGPYVIALLIGLTATVANQMIEQPSAQAVRRYGAPLAALLAAVVATGQARLTLSPPASGPMVKLAAVTPDLAARQASDALISRAPLSSSPAAPVSLARVRQAHAVIAQQLLAATRTAALAGARIVVWSETAAPVLAEDKPLLLARVSEIARTEGVYINAAIGVARERNETFLYGPDGRQLWHYRKNHPVPGMEPVSPFRNAVPVAATPFGRLSNLICFDGDFPDLARVDADLMLEPSWDWPEVAYAHTFRMLRLRAIENGYVLVRPVFNGVTGAFDRYGRTLSLRETMSAGAHTLLLDVPIGGGRTIYNRIGDVFAWLCALTASGLLISAVRGRR